jgi:hypothetical protein
MTCGESRPTFCVPKSGGDLEVTSARASGWQLFPGQPRTFGLTATMRF